MLAGIVQDKTLSELTEKIRSRPFYKGVLVRSVLYKDGNSAKMSTIVAVAQGERSRVRAVHRYSPVELREDWFETDQFLKWLEQIVLGRVELPDGTHFDVKGNWYPQNDLIERYLPSNYEYMNVDWPSDHYKYAVTEQAAVTRPPSSIECPLGLPYFPGGFEAAEWWLGTNDLSRIDLIGRIVVLLPNLVARIQEVEIGSKYLSTAIQSKHPERKLLLRLFAKDYQTARTFQRDLPVGSDNKIQVDIDIDWTSLNLVLVDQETGELLDHRSLHSSWTELPKGVKRHASASDLQDLIRRGEREDIEFKETLTNHEDIIKTIVAFANTRGGMLLIGVSEEGGVVQMKQDPGTIEPKVRSWTRDWCSPVPQLEFQLETLYEHQIVIILVRELNDKPCWMRDKGPMIRYGPNNRVASREEAGLMFTKETRWGA